MRDIKNLTVIICSYKANKEFKLCLHQLARYGFTGNQLLIVENSPSEYISNRELLAKHGIRYINNPNGMHAMTVNQVIGTVTTDYVLLLDSDCFLTADPIPHFEKVKTHGIQLYGDVCGDRAGLHIHKRVHPWWCFIDVTFLKQNNIQFIDFQRMVESDSMSFIDRTQLMNARDPKKFYYDSGSTMYEDVIKCGGIVADVGDVKPYIHIEGASWRREFKEYEEVVASMDNWVNLLYPKLLFEEKYLDLLRYVDPTAVTMPAGPVTETAAPETDIKSEQVEEKLESVKETEHVDSADNASVVEPEQVSADDTKPKKKKHK